MKVSSLLLILAFTGSLHAKPILDTVEAFSQYRQGIPVTVEQGRGGRSLGEMVESDSYSIRELLRALQLVEEGKRKGEIPHLQRLYEIHDAKSFPAVHGHLAPFVRADDVDGDLCRVIKGLILRLDFGNQVQQIDLSPARDIRFTLSAVKDVATKLLTDLREGEFAKGSPEANAVPSAIRATLDKLDSVIEEEYKPQMGTANIAPPPGTPNAAAGMSPDAISDPELRRQYLESFANEEKKQWKNHQQSDARTARKVILMQVSSLDAFGKEERIERFTNEGKSRELLREMMSPG